MKKILSCVYIAFLVAVTMGCIKKKIKAEDLPLLVKAADIVALGYELYDYQDYEKASRITYFDRSQDIEYELEFPDDSDNIFYLYSCVNIEKNAFEARSAYTIIRSSSKLGIFFAGDKNIKYIKANDYFSYGDESTLYFIAYDGEIIGYAFFSRAGRKVYTFIISGIEFGSNNEFKALILPKLKYMEKYP
jgi:hypothetical protein